MEQGSQSHFRAGLVKASPRLPPPAGRRHWFALVRSNERCTCCRENHRHPCSLGSGSYCLCCCPPTLMEYVWPLLLPISGPRVSWQQVHLIGGTRSRAHALAAREAARMRTWHFPLFFWEGGGVHISWGNCMRKGAGVERNMVSIGLRADQCGWSRDKQRDAG